jgi:hypothetical protein
VQAAVHPEMLMHFKEMFLVPPKDFNAEEAKHTHQTLDGKSKRNDTSSVCVTHEQCPQNGKVWPDGR